MSSEDGIHWDSKTNTGIKSRLRPSIASYNEKLHLVYVADDGDNSLSITSSSSGKNWSNSSIIRNENTDMAATVGKFEDRLFVAFVANDSTNNLVVTSSMDGITWSKPQIILHESSQMAPDFFSRYYGELSPAYIA